MFFIFFTEFNEFSEKHLGKTQLCLCLSIFHFENHSEFNPNREVSELTMTICGTLPRYC